MKKFFILIGLVVSGLGAHAQTRKHVANFSQAGNYFNPALTGNQGSILKSIYRDQWTGFDDAPRTLFFSGEVNLSDVKNKTLLSTDSAAAEDASAPVGVQHAFGVSLLNYSFGPYRENQFALNYSTGVRLTQSLRLQGGIGLTYDNNRLSSNDLVFNEANDRGYYAMMNGQERVNKFGLNLGLALASQDFYLGYAVQNLVQESTSDNDFLKEMYGMQHMVNAGVRKGLTDQVGLVLNGMYRYNSDEKGVLEGQVKGVYNNLFWVGAGYRQDLAYTFSAGMRYKQFNIGYTREAGAGKADGSNVGANEFMVSYNLSPVLSSVGKTLTIW
uniref:PorP/SprF family type IX secretion system membrane protein n=1 Tax=Rufibacter radiotolerans TaxID=1379910 RepID=UPI0006645FAF|nr:PorP/SprF family type IX secretion system membrane protein [Rufibacter radiotolerans]